MANTIKCPNCGKEFEPSDAFKHDLEEKLLSKEREKHLIEIEKIRTETEKHAAEKIKQDYDIQIKQLAQDSSEEKERSKKLLKQLEVLNEEKRVLTRKDEERELEMKKKLAEEEEKIRREVRKKTEEEHDLKDAEKDKKLTDALKQVEELKKKIEQGSQQSQGEVLELEIEKVLRVEFPADIIQEVKKGQRGADIVQEVIDKNGHRCGVILWESKNAEWSGKWLDKLKEDQRNAKADQAVLVATKPPEEIRSYAYVKNVWVTSRQMIVPLALSLRYALVKLNFEKMKNVGKNEKMEILYQYVTSAEFMRRLEAIGEAFSENQKEIEREKRWFQTKWAREEKQLRKVFDNTHGMIGDLQGLIGKALPEVKSLQLGTGDEE